MTKKYIASFSGGKDSTAMTLRLIEEGKPLDDIVFFDTGWEFEEMYSHIEKFEKYTGIKVTYLHPRRSFNYWMIERPIIKRGTNNIHRIGNGWPSPSRRWCTREKIETIDRHCGNAIRYIGIASDEIGRIERAKRKPKRYIIRYPLFEWDMSEADALEYCKARGFDWGGLYDIMPRVSCFCCPLQRIGQLRTLRNCFPHLWNKMLEWDNQIGPHNRGFRGYERVTDLEKRFYLESLQMSLFEEAQA